jgi:acylphosphatase
MTVRAHILISGVVQGVFFRSNTRRKANEFKVNGWVKNLRDGRVEVVCEGAEESVKKLIAWSKKGPEGAYVSSADVTWENYTGEFNTFEINY